MLESNPNMKTMQIHKAPPTCKSSWPNLDDTDTEDDSDSCNAAVSSDGKVRFSPVQGLFCPNPELDLGFSLGC